MLPSISKSSPTNNSSTQRTSNTEKVNHNNNTSNSNSNTTNTTDNQKESTTTGQLFTWGKSTSGQLGQQTFIHPRNSGCCALPYPVPGMNRVASVACGGLDNGYTVLATEEGKVFSFGKDLFGRLGHGDQGRADVNISVPLLIPSLTAMFISSVAAGTEHAAGLTTEGHVWSWGRNIGGCLGRGTLGSRSEKVTTSNTTTNNPANNQSNNADESLPQPVQDLGHGRSSWIGTYYGRIAKKDIMNTTDTKTTEKTTSKTRELRRSMLAHVVKIGCEYHYSGALLSDGRMVTWGTNSHGQLGVDDQTDRALPNQVKGLSSVVDFDLGTRHCAAITRTGKLYTWGNNSHGGLGVGDRKDRLIPTQVVGNDVDLQVIVCVSCSRTQGWQNGGNESQSVVRIQKGAKSKQKNNQKNKQKNKKTKNKSMNTMKPLKSLKKYVSNSSNGSEGGHTCILTKEGAMYTFGTAHNGVLANLGRKTSAVGKNWDQLIPYLVGSPLCDEQAVQKSMVTHTPMSPYACWPNYNKCGPFVKVATSHDHCLVVNTEGELWGWGNGTDGRVGVERFLNMSGENRNGKTGGLKPPVVDRCKCIMMGPHRVGLARKMYWPGGNSLKNYYVTNIATGKNFGACIGVPRKNTEGSTLTSKTSPRGPWLPLGERTGYNDVTPPVRLDWNM